MPEERSLYLFASVLSAAIFGVEVCPVQVEADVSNGLPSFIMVGFPSAQVKEAQERVRTALKNNGYQFPPKRITVNFAPADMKKEGAGFDVPVAAAVLAAFEMISPQVVSRVMMAGEIGLDGEIHGISGILPIVLCARSLGSRFCVVPYENLKEGRLIRDVPVAGVKNLRELVECLKNPEPYLKREIQEEIPSIINTDMGMDFSDIEGQEGAKRAAEIAVSGFHNLLLIGPPGTGKTMLARRLPTIMPGLGFEEKLELTRIYSIAGLLSREHPLIDERPFRSPHHTSTPQAIAGGGRNPRPGEITLAHKGVLFLDEMPEFSRASLELLRQPMEDKVIQIARASGTYNFPADFMLCAAMNPCPCGYYNHPTKACVCSPGQVQKYLNRISGPLLDRIDLQIEVIPVPFEKMSDARPGESSADIRERVVRARQIQSERYSEVPGIYCNAQMNSKLLARYARPDDNGLALLKSAMNRFNLSARAYDRILKVSRTIADLEGCELIQPSHLAEAIGYRNLDREDWAG